MLTPNRKDSQGRSQTEGHTIAWFYDDRKRQRGTGTAQWSSQGLHHVLVGNAKTMNQRSQRNRVDV